MDQELKEKEIKRRTRTYKSTNPTKIINDGWCHQCKIKQPEVLACVNFWKNRKNKKCNGKYCPKCIDKHYNEDYEKLKSQEEWICYSCEYICKCASCKRKRGSYVCRRKTPNGKKMKGEYDEDDTEFDGQYTPQYDQFEDRYENDNQHVEYNQSITQHQHNQYNNTQQQYVPQYYPQYTDNSQQQQYVGYDVKYVPPQVYNQQYQYETKILYNNNVDQQQYEQQYSNTQYNNNYNTQHQQQYVQYDNDIPDPGQHTEPYPIEPNIPNNVNHQMESQLPSINNLFNLCTSQELPNIYNHPNNIYQSTQRQSQLDNDFFSIPISFNKGGTLLPPILDRSKLSFLINNLQEEISSDMNNNQSEEYQNPTSSTYHDPLASTNDENNNNINNSPNNNIPNNSLPIYIKTDPK